MFTQSLPAPAPAPSSSGIHVSSSTSPASPTSRSRLRGLSYLRNYTQSHILNREHSNSGTAPTSPTAVSSPVSVVHITNRQPDAAESTYPLRQTQSAAATSPSVPTSAPSPTLGLGLTPVVSHPSTPTPSSQSFLSDSSAQSRSRSPRHAAGLPAPASASLAVSPLQAYGLDSQSTPPLSTTPTPATALLQTASSTAPSLAVHSLAASAANITTISSAAAASTSATTPTPATMTRSRSVTEPGSSSSGTVENLNLPSIRFSTFYDPRATRPSLKFSPMSRTLPTGAEVIRVGRYSERDSQPTAKSGEPSASHVGFKSKVVSRRHCEFWYESGRWYIKDVKSSSGTFLNHIRLSQPGTESKPYPVNDGDIIQLGIDFKGGEEMIFRCVKMRIELNRDWQNKPNAFNLNTHKRLRNLTKSADTDASGQSTQDCSICLNSIAPCQSLFVAPCSHTWHYKCIRALLDSPQYPSFTCPNCRAAVDLEADVEDPPDEWDDMEVEEPGVEAPSVGQMNASATETDLVTIDSSSANSEAAASSMRLAAPTAAAAAVGSSSNGPILEEADLEREPDFGEETAFIDSVMEDADRPPVPPIPEQLQGDSPLERSDDEAEPVVSHATVNPVSIPSPSRAAPSILGRAVTGSGTLAAGGATGTEGGAALRQTRTPSPSDLLAAPQAEGPITPRNDHGPWVFDGSGIRISSSRASIDSHRGEMRSLDMATAELAGQSS